MSVKIVKRWVLLNPLKGTPGAPLVMSHLFYTRLEATVYKKQNNYNNGMRPYKD